MPLQGSGTKNRAIFINRGGGMGMPYDDRPEGRMSHRFRGYPTNKSSSGY